MTVVALFEDSDPHRTALLRAVLRPAFQAEQVQIPPGHAVFGYSPCIVATCNVPSRGKRFCHPHNVMWYAAGRPPFASWAEHAEPASYKSLDACLVPACYFGAAGRGLCGTHVRRWKRSGVRATDLAAWAADADALPDGEPCGVPACDLWRNRLQPYCQSHNHNWRRLGKPTPSDFLPRYGPSDVNFFDLRRLKGLLRLEFQYGLQLRDDRRSFPTQAPLINGLVDLLVRANVGRLSDLTVEEVRAGAIGIRTTKQARFLCETIEALQDLYEPDRDEFALDQWRLGRIGYADTTVRAVSFTSMEPLWFKEAVKAWCRFRVITNIAANTLRGDVQTLDHFGRFLRVAGVQHPSEVTRKLLMDYMASHTRGNGICGAHMGTVNTFLAHNRVHKWLRGVPADAQYYAEDYPRRAAQRLPRALEEYVMKQIEDPKRQALLPDRDRVILTVLIDTGMRISSAVRLGIDCLVLDKQAAPYLRYVNTKMRREAMVPISSELADIIRVQQARQLDRFGSKVPVLFSAEIANPDGRKYVSAETIRGRFHRWLLSSGLQDELGRPIKVTPHQLRHTFATRLVNDDVPVPVIQVLLDHESPSMTQHYARIRENKVREEWERARKVDVRGTVLEPATSPALVNAAWTKDQLARAKQALPNGYCGLPPKKNCAHANACLTCPLFITTEEFLPVHRDHLKKTQDIVITARERGQDRVVEMNERVARNLMSIIAAFPPVDDDPTDPA